MQCPHCGAAVDGEASFCDECGKPLHTAKVAIAGTLQDAEARPDVASETKPLSKQPRFGQARAQALAWESAKITALPEHRGRRGAPRIIISHWSMIRLDAIKQITCSEETKGILHRAMGPRNQRYADAFEMLEAFRKRADIPEDRVRSLKNKCVVFTGPLSIARAILDFTVHQLVDLRF